MPETLENRVAKLELWGTNVVDRALKDLKTLGGNVRDLELQVRRMESDVRNLQRTRLVYKRFDLRATAPEKDGWTRYDWRTFSRIIDDAEMILGAWPSHRLIPGTDTHQYPSGPLAIYVHSYKQEVRVAFDTVPTSGEGPNQGPFCSLIIHVIYRPKADPDVLALPGVAVEGGELTS